MSLCNRCIVNESVVTRIVAIRDTKERREQEAFEYPTDIQRLITWAESKLENGWQITMNAWSNTFRPVAMWHGDPVCEVHLRELRDTEIKERFRQHPRRY